MLHLSGSATILCSGRLSRLWPISGHLSGIKESEYGDISFAKSDSKPTLSFQIFEVY